MDDICNNLSVNEIDCIPNNHTIHTHYIALLHTCCLSDRAGLYHFSEKLLHSLKVEVEMPHSY